MGSPWSFNQTVKWSKLWVALGPKVPFPIPRPAENELASQKNLNQWANDEEQKAYHYCIIFVVNQPAICFYSGENKLSIKPPSKFVPTSCAAPQQGGHPHQFSDPPGLLKSATNVSRRFLPKSWPAWAITGDKCPWQVLPKLRLPHWLHRCCKCPIP